MLDLVWNAYFKKNSKLECIRQFEENGKEHKFQEVLDNQKDLEYFALYNKKTNYLYVVNLIDGIITKGQHKQPALPVRADMLRKEKCKYRLIYFREVERTFTRQLKEIGDPKIIYFLGFQYLDSNNKNHKRMMKIHPDGREVIN